jgi:ferric-dicitrate binding protein FerR (iron transport regulator)
VVDLQSSGADPAWEQALDWVMLMRDGLLDSLGERRLLEWLDQSSRHVQAFRQALQVWQATGALAPEFRAALDQRLMAPPDDRSVRGS